MELELIRSQESHIDGSAKIMERAFDKDTRLHLGEEKGGPDGNDDGTFLRKCGFHIDGIKFNDMVWTFHFKTIIIRDSFLKRPDQSGLRPGSGHR